MKNYLLLMLPLFLATDAFSQSDRLPQSKAIIMMKQGKPIESVQIWRIRPGVLEYEKDGSLHDVAIQDIDIIKSGNDEYELVNNTIKKVILVGTTSQTEAIEDTATEEKPRSEMIASANPLETTESADRNVAFIDYYQLGRQDAQKYYSGTGAFFGGLLTGPFIAPIIAIVPPSNPGIGNPNAAIYYSNHDYHKGYQKTAHGKKASNVLAGLGVFVGIILLASAAAY